MRVAISIVLNGAHHLERQAKEYCLDTYVDKWIIVHGASKNVHCTAWCKEIPDKYHKKGKSVDATNRLLLGLKNSHDNIIVVEKDGMWEGKVEMFNAALEHVTEDCWLWQIDIDEYWEKAQMEGAEKVLENLGADVGAFTCDYLLSDDIIVRGAWGESIQHGYRRLWKYQPGRKFLSHEPPKIEGEKTQCPMHLLPRFKHLSYYDYADVKFKAAWYGNHENIHEGWDDIVKGKTPLPCGIDQLFRTVIPEDWKKTIITYR
tara:strand:- start:155092 stop:155871 length:780 start_codon:yes stop_codon:yes gene_type:complete